MGHDAAATDNSDNSSKELPVRAEKTIGKVAKPHEEDARNKDVSCKTPKENKTEVATYPVGSKVAGELACELSTHHDNNSTSITVPSEATIEVNAKKPAPLLLVIAHGAVIATLSAEGTFPGVTNFHGRIKHPTEETSCDSHAVDNDRRTVSSCHPNFTGVYKLGSTGEDLKGTLNNSTLHTV